MKYDVYDTSAKKVSSIELSEDIFGARWNPNLVHDVYVSMEANARTPVAHTKMRGEVRGGGIKPWKQKGTGRARHGSIRSPLWVGGGVTHGPRNDRDFSKKINKKAKLSALKSLISKKLSDNEMIFVSALSMNEPKTKEARTIMTNLSSISGFERLKTGRKNTALFVLPESNENFEKSIRNFGNIDVTHALGVDVRDLLTYKFVVVISPDETLKTLEARLNQSREKVTA